MDGRIKLCNFHLKNIVCFYGQKEIKNDIMQKSTYVFCQILTEEKCWVLKLNAKRVNKTLSHLFFYLQESIEKMRLERKNSNRIFILPINEKEALKVRKAYKKLTYADRQTIEHMTEQGAEPKKIAEVTGVHVATIYRELKKGADTEGHYKAELAQQALFV